MNAVSDWWVTVHTERHGPFADSISAHAAARNLKRQNPNKHVTVVDPKGISTPIG
jgi:hypothetical protein